MPLVKLDEDGGYAGAQADCQSLEDFLATAPNDPDTIRGVRLNPEDDVQQLAPYLDKLGLIEISFPRYTDGRGYSQAQLLRRRHGYKGEIRAVGDVLRDQLLFMMRSGINAFDLSRPDAEEAFAAAAKEYSAFYQPAADGETGVFARRHARPGP